MKSQGKLYSDSKSLSITDFYFSEWKWVGHKVRRSATQNHWPRSRNSQFGFFCHGWEQNLEVASVDRGK